MGLELTTGEIISAVGIFLDIIGVGLLTVSGILSKKPLQTSWYLWRHVDKENPESTEKEPPTEMVSKLGGGFGSGLPPKDAESYKWQIKTVTRQWMGAAFLIVGFSLQLVGTLI